MINFKVSTANEQTILSHLKKCDEVFITNLKERVDIWDYSQKIKMNAILFEAWENNKLIGLIAIYYNDIKGETAYITNVSVLKQYENRGIATKLMKECINFGQQHCFKYIRLEVESNNVNAIRIYEKFGFYHITLKENKFLLMELKI